MEARSTRFVSLLPGRTHCLAVGLFVMLVFVLFPQRVSGSEEKHPPDSKQNESRSVLEWWLGSDRAEITGYAGGRRVMTRDGAVEELREDRLGTIETKDGELFEATEQGRVQQVGRSARRAASEAVEQPAAAGVSPKPQNLSATAASRLPEKAAKPKPKREIAAMAIPSEAFVLGQSALGMLLRLTAVIIFLRALLSWVDVSYSYASVMRFGVVVMVLGELSLLLISGGLHAG
jgi:hypothetical protein